MLPGVHVLCRCLRFFLLWGPDAFSGAGEVDGDALDLGRDPVEGLSQAEVAAEAIGPPALPHLLDQFLRIFAGAFGLLADQLFDFVVGDLDAELVGGGLEHGSRAIDWRASARTASRSCSGDWPVSWR